MMLQKLQKSLQKTFSDLQKLKKKCSAAFMHAVVCILTVIA